MSIVFTDERLPVSEREVTYCYEGGIVDYVRYLNAEKNPLHEDVIYLEGGKDDFYYRCAFQLTDSYTESMFSYVNSIPTGEGGTHETGFGTINTNFSLLLVRELCYLFIGGIAEKLIT